MMKVSNGKTIRRLGWRSMKAARTRNLIAVLAIALTTVLFTSLFTIAMSINDGFQQSNFRQVGGFSHGGFKYLTEEQFNNLKVYRNAHGGAVQQIPRGGQLRRRQ